MSWYQEVKRIFPVSAYLEKTGRQFICPFDWGAYGRVFSVFACQKINRNKFYNCRLVDTGHI